MGLLSIFKQSKTLYFPGCVTYFKFKTNFEIYKKIFNKLGIDFKIADEKICCGLPALEGGYELEARKLAKKNFEIFKNQGIKSIITNSPCCYRMFNDYKKILFEWDIEIKNIWNIILTKLKENPELIKNKIEDTIFYQDSCYLSRYHDIYNEPREILRLIGCEIKEIDETKKENLCCGSCGGLTITNPKLADDIAKERLKQIKRTNTKNVVVSSLSDYELLKKNSKDFDIKIWEFSEVLALALGIFKEKNLKEMIEKEEREEENRIISEVKEKIEIEKNE